MNHAFSPFEHTSSQVHSVQGKSVTTPNAEERMKRTEKNEMIGEAFQCMLKTFLCTAEGRTPKNKKKK